MNAHQIEFYNSLTPDEQYILNVAALMGTEINSSKVLYSSNQTFKTTEKAVKATIELGIKGGLLYKGDYYHAIAKVEFMIFIFPTLKDYDEEHHKIVYDFRFYYGNKVLRNFSDLLYGLLFDNQIFKRHEETFIIKGNDVLYERMWALFEDERYHSKLNLLSKGLIKSITNAKVNSSILKLNSLSALQKEMATVLGLLSSETASEVTEISGITAFNSGNFKRASEICEKSKLPLGVYCLGVEWLLKGDFKISLVEFEKGLKLERAVNKGRQIPLFADMACFYYMVILCLPPEQTGTILRKINESLEKKPLVSSDHYFKAIGYYALNEKPAFNRVLSEIENLLEKSSHDYPSLMSIIILYLVDKTPKTSSLENCYNTVKKAYNNGYWMTAYEASYCLFQWSNDAKIVKLYDEIRANFTFAPAISQISHQEEWEKNLNSLLSLGGDNIAKVAKDEATSRVVYTVDFESGYIQPRLQTRNKSGWSAGRNIALKTFKNGVDGMTEQDIRISNKVKVSHGGYYGGEEYYLPTTAINELVGHPYIFLKDSNDIFVELIVAKPSVEVVKTTRGYLLKSELEVGSDKLMIQKETNTRYKIYDLSAKQLAILKTIQQDQIIVPEKGKDKLMQVLSLFSSHLTVQSDLAVAENNNVKTVEADSKIRVQLLPMGDGFKAELFAKPFGTHPPYCKPGKGGKTLIYNEKGEQLQVLRSLNSETENANALMQDIQMLESIELVDGLIEFANPLDALSLLDILGNHQDKCVVEWPEGERFKIKGSASFGNLKFNIKSKAGWFDLQGELRVNESTVISIQELLQLSHKSKNRFIELNDGEFLALSEQLKKQLEELYTFSTSGKEGLQINKFASVALTDFFDEVTDFKADKSWKEFQTRIKEVEKADIQLPSTLQAELRPYQVEGFRWMARIAQWEGGACLADDMGLGKTLQTLAILLHRAPLGSALVVCPVSVVPNWINEVAKFAPALNVKTLTSGNREQILNNLAPNDLLITSYGILQSEEKALTETIFTTIVLDEAHAIKNFTTKTSKAAMQLQAPFRVALTGTPIQNHLGEVWNLFNFINPGLLGTQKQFTDTFIKTDNELARKHLKKLIAPFILRRLKSAVLDELPPKIEVVKRITLSNKETAYYEALRRQAIINMECDDSAQGTKHLKALAEITRLRQACCNVALVDPTLQIESSKLSTFLEIVDDLIENRHRALVFSQFVTHLSLVRAELNKRGIKYQYLDGSSPMNEREQSVKKFQSGEGDLFLISLKAGGLGLNLTAADYVIHLDPWWNPAIEDQASDRAHRFGQSRPVTIYRLVAENTIEEKILELHNTKRDLADSLLEGSDQSAKLSMAELVSLIKERE